MDAAATTSAPAMWVDKKPTVLITGDKGFVGTATKNYFIEKNWQIIGFDLMDRADIRDKKQFERVVRELRPNRILHLAAIARFQDAQANRKLAFETNVIGTRNVAQVAAKYHIPVVYSSTGSIYMPITEEPPITEEFAISGNSPYGCSKAIGEDMIMAYAHPWMILRYAHLYGKEKRMHGLIGGYLDRLKFGMAPILYGGAQSNDFSYIDDIAQANYLACNAPWDKWNQAYNIGTGEELSAEAAGKLVIEVYNEYAHGSTKYKPYKGEVEKKPQRTVDPTRFVFDVKKAERMLNFKTEFNFKEGLREMFKDGL